MIRILHVIGSLNNGGSQSMVMNLYRKIDRKKVQFDFIINKADELFYADEIKSLGGKIYVTPTFNSKNIFKFIKAWNEFFKEHPEYRIIHGHIRSTASIYLKIAKNYGLVTIAHSHSTSSGSGLSAIVKNILQYPIRNTAEYFFACSKSAGEWLFGKSTCKKENFFILNNAIDAEKFIFNEEIRRNKRTEFNIEDKFVIGHIGRFNTPKNHNFLIDIFKDIYEKNNNVVLLLVGDGELQQVLNKKIKEFGIENQVIFTGVRADISDLLQAMDVFVFPSIYEGLGIVVIEAQATGLHCIVSEEVPKEAYVTKLVEGESLNSSTDTWVKAILQYSSGYDRKDTYEEIKTKGYDICDTASWLEAFYINKEVE